MKAIRKNSINLLMPKKTDLQDGTRPHLQVIAL